MDTEELRKIDALIERHIFGREPVEREYSRTANPRGGYSVIGISYPSYSSSITAAFVVIEELRKRHLYLMRLSNGDTNWICCVAAGLTGGREAIVVEDTAPLAICRAALKAIEKENPR